MLGERLKKLRDRTGLNQEEFSKIIGISRGTYAHYETNKRLPSYDILEKIAKYHEVSLDYLITGKNEEENLHFFNLEGLDEEEIADIKSHIEFVKWKARDKK